MGNATIIIGIACVTIIISYIMFKLNQGAYNQNGEKEGDNHAFLQILMFFFIVLMIFLIGKVTVDDKDNCVWNVINSTTIGANTQYTYDYQCSTNANTTSLTFYKLVNAFVYLVFAYVFIFYGYKILKTFIEWVQQK